MRLISLKAVLIGIVAALLAWLGSTLAIGFIAGAVYLSITMWLTMTIAAVVFVVTVRRMVRRPPSLPLP